MPQIYSIYKSEDNDELSFFPNDHPSADLLKLDVEGIPMKLVLEFEAPTISFARMVYNAYLEDPQIATRLLRTSL